MYNRWMIETKMKTGLGQSFRSHRMRNLDCESNCPLRKEKKAITLIIKTRAGRFIQCAKYKINKK